MLRAWSPALAVGVSVLALLRGSRTLKLGHQGLALKVDIGTLTLLLPLSVSKLPLDDQVSSTCVHILTCSTATHKTIKSNALASKPLKP